MSTYRFSMDDDDIVAGLISNYVRAGLRLVDKAPPMEVRVYGGTVRFRWVGVGRRYYHPVYVYAVYDEKRGAIILVNKPRYPAYLFAIIGALYLSGFIPSAVVNRGGEIRALVTPDAGAARAIAREALRETPLVSGRRFLELDVSFEGYLYRVPVGYVAFLSRKPFLTEYDIIEEHEEHGGWRRPIDIPFEFWRRMVESVAGEKGLEGGG